MGTEDTGAWRYDPRTQRWTNFTSKNGLGDDNGYAIGCDKLGRIWVGTRSHGVSIYNGSEWETIDSGQGLLGSRVFAMATCPTNGDVWIATEAGLTRYSLKYGTWSYRTQLDGLPSDQASCLAFDRHGNLFVGTQCDGIAIGSASSGYHKWRLVPGPARVANLPDRPAGSGLPSSMINCLLVARNGDVYAGTDAGLAVSANDGRSWHYRRGADWVNRTQCRANGSEPDTLHKDNQTLDEDYVCSLAEDDSGGIWVGHRLVGLERISSNFARSGTNSHDTSIASPPSQGSVVPAGAHIPDGKYKIVSHSSSLALDGSGGAGAGTVQQTYSGANEEWVIKSVGNSYYKIISASNGMALTGASLFDQLSMHPYASSRYQQWRFYPSGSFYNIANRASGEVIDVLCQLLDPGQPVGQWTTDGLDNQQWSLVSLSDRSTAAVHRGVAIGSGNASTRLNTSSAHSVLQLDAAPAPNGWATAEIAPLAQIRALLPAGDLLYIGTYGDGMTAYKQIASASDRFTPVRKPIPVNPPLPTIAGPPVLGHMNDMLRVLSQVPPDVKGGEPQVVALDDDWRTEGSWLGRYGRYWACLCGMDTPDDYVWGAGSERIDYKGTIGPNHSAGDVLRCWTSWAYGDDPRSLEIPPVSLRDEVDAGQTTWQKDRRQSEWDDLGEAYGRWVDGPNLFATLTVPAGLFYLSLYEINKDGHKPMNWFRDYRISIREHRGKSLIDVSDFYREPELAHVRVCDYWGGVWKRLLVHGPVTLTVRIDRNGSLNTNLYGITLDLVDQDPPLYYHTPLQWFEIKSGENKERAKLIAAWQKQRGLLKIVPATSQAEGADRIVDKLDQVRLTNPAWWAQNGPRFYTMLLPWYEHMVKVALPDEQRREAYRRLGTCYYQTCHFAEWEDCQGAVGIVPARQIELSLRSLSLPRVTSAPAPVGAAAKLTR